MNLRSDSLNKPEFEVTKLLEGKQQRICWCAPLVVSFLLMILLGATSFVTTSVHPKAGTLFVVDESTTFKTESTTSRESLTMAPFMAPTEAANHVSVHFWMDNILKPLLLEVGALALFQSVGAIPTLTKVLLLASRGVHTKVGWWRLFSNKNTARLLQKVNKGIKWKSPRMVQRFADSVKRIYKSRSRLSAASDITHVIGDDAADNETKLSDNNTEAP